MLNPRQLALLVRTLRHLRPAQIGHRVRLRTQRRLITWAPGLGQRVLSRRVPPERGWPADFVPVDARLGPLWPSPDLLADGRIVLLGHEREMSDWRSTEPPQLWRYHLHYWDWAWSLALDKDRLKSRAIFARLLAEWERQTLFGRWDEWSPYVVALRAWAWCGQYDALMRGRDADEEFVALLGLHAGYLTAHLELDVGGNHLIKDLKALIGLGVFLRDDELVERALRRLKHEVAHQVLPDGGHFERAPAYHCQVLADLIDLDGLLGAQSPRWLGEAVSRMRTWLGLVLLPDGSVPLLNDGFPVPATLLDILAPGPAAPLGLTVLSDSGLVIMRRGQGHVLADVGLPCPDDLPAHAHADTLGFLLYVGTRRVVAELGTSTYSPGPVRSAERSTAAHSTVEIDGVDSTEVWGTFRAARRARPTVLDAQEDSTAATLSASHDGYARLAGRPIHRRTWVLTDESLRVVDDVEGDGDHELVVRLHGTEAGVLTSPRQGWTPEEVSVAQGWEDRAVTPVLVHRERVSLPWHLEVVLSTRGLS